MNAASVITNSGTLAAFTTGYVDTVIRYMPDNLGLAGPDRFYRVSVPPSERVLAVLKPSDFDADLLLVDAASTSGTTNWTLLSASRRSIATNGHENAGWGNTSSSNRDVLIVIDSGSVLGGHASLDVFLGAGPIGDSPYAPEDVLSTAQISSGSMSNVVNDVVTYGTVTNILNGRDRFYAVRVTPGQRVYSTLTPTNMNLALLVVDAEGLNPAEWSVLAFSDVSSSPSGAESAGWRNGTLATNELLIAVDGMAEPMDLNRYGLSIRIEPIPDGESTDEAPTVSSGVYTGNTTNYLSDRSGYVGSSVSYPGRDRFYRVTVPPGERIMALLSHTNNDAALLLLDTNQVLRLEADNSSGLTSTEFVGWSNTNPIPVDLFVGIDAKGALAGITYGLTIAVGPEPLGDRPESPEVLTGGGIVTGATTNYLNDLSAYSLIGSYPGRDRFYRVPVPSGARLHATLALRT